MSDVSKDSGGWSGESDDVGKGASRRAQENEDAIAFGRKFGLGCFTFFIGAFSGGMIAVALGMAIEGLRRSPRCEGLPVCNWYVYVVIGALVGAVSLPVLVLNRLRRR